LRLFLPSYEDACYEINTLIANLLLFNKNHNNTEEGGGSGVGGGG
jgi:hypothetical protein